LRFVPTGQGDVYGGAVFDPSDDQFSNLGIISAGR
jgi:hypothetical protein